MRRRKRLPAVALPLLLIASLVAGVAAPAVAGGEETQGLEEARAAAQQATQDYADAQAALGTIDQELAQLAAQQSDAEAELAALEDDVAEAIVDQYIDAGIGAPVVPSGNLNEQAEADALFRLVNQHDNDVIDQYRDATARRDAAIAAIETKHAEQATLIAQLEDTQARLEAELAVLEELERDRVAEEVRRAQEAAEAAAAERTRATDAPDGPTPTDPVEDDEPSASTTDPPVTSSPPSTSPPVDPPPSGGGMICPVPGSTFVDSFGDPRPQGWAHQGVDMMAASGTPILAPVSGFVAHRGNSVGGNAFHLDGTDGRYYYGAHLSSYGASGQVEAGTVIGYVGNTGDAAATAPHLHLEIHIGGVAVNPYPYVAAVC